MQPLVTVVCLCYNHARFIREALDSVLNQTYPNLEIIIVDDYSSDNSREIIAEYVRKFPQLIYLPNERNLGNCTAFNRAWEISKGEYLIDFATDDVLMPERISEQVAVLESLDQGYGIMYTDAELIDDNDRHLGYFYKRDAEGNLLDPVPSGDVFADVVARHFICTPTMIMRRSVFGELGGYDATLAYEDFDLWVRSARTFKFYFLDKPLTKRRIHAAQMSQQQYKPSDRQIFSTIEVCRKAQQMLRNEAEKQALITRVEYELTQAYLTRNKIAGRFLKELLLELEPLPVKIKVLRVLSRVPLVLPIFRKLYQRFRK
jgi:glycosyltransferase involved in cell wall biosynthesis